MTSLPALEGPVMVDGAPVSAVHRPADPSVPAVTLRRQSMTGTETGPKRRMMKKRRIEGQKNMFRIMLRASWTG